jgi:hypothetical protein
LLNDDVRLRQVVRLAVAIAAVSRTVLATARVSAPIPSMADQPAICRSRPSHLSLGYRLGDAFFVFGLPRNRF